MKHLRKIIAILLSCVLMAAVFPLAVACGKGNDDNGGGSSGGGGSTEKINYSVTAQRSSGDPFAGATVLVYDSARNIVELGYTDKNGTFAFKADPATYTVEFGGKFEAGYKGANNYTVTAQNPEAVFKMAASVIPTEAPAGCEYAIGSVMHDFSYTDTLGNSNTLSGLLGTKKAVFLNFWYTTCSYCISEFPDIKKVYLDYKDDIEVLCLDYYDELAEVEAFRNNVNGYYEWNTLPFPMISKESGLANSLKTKFGVTGCPTSIMIDREGVVCFMAEGAGVEAEFRELFAYYTATEYKQKIHFPGTGSMDKPDVAAPSSAEVQAAINNTDSGYTAGYYFDEDEYNWPWVVCDDGKSLKASNSTHHNSYAIMYSDFEATSSQVLAFDYKTSCDSDDQLIVFIDNVPTHYFGGLMTDWTTCYAYVPVKANGKYTVSFTYVKDQSVSMGDDTAYIKNVRFVSPSDIDDRTEIVYRCAGGERVNNRYSEYTDVAYNYKDNYYHVGDENGPLLLVDLMNATAWSNNSAWSYVAGSDLKFDLDHDGTVEDYTEMFTVFAQYANCSRRYGLLGVTKELKTCLDALTNKFSTGYEKEWLEMCSYIKIYGGEEGEKLIDPITGISYYTAYDAVLNTSTNPNKPIVNHVNKETLIMPRGMWFKFTPSTTGIYKIYSDAEIDSYCWIRDDRLNIIAENDDDPDKPSSENGNFAITMLLEKDKLYYVLPDYNTPDQLGEFDFVIDLLATSGNVWKAACGGEYTANIDEQGNLSDYYLKDAVDYVLGDDGCYHVGSKTGPLLYINLRDYSNMFPDMSIEDMIPVECYYCKACGSKYHDSVKAFETETESMCWICGNKEKSAFAKTKTFELPTPMRDKRGKIMVITYTYDDGYVNLVPLYELKGLTGTLDVDDYLDALAHYEINFTDYTQVVTDAVLSTDEPGVSPHDPDEVGFDGVHVGYAPATAELVDALQKLIMFGDYSFSPHIENAWLMLAAYYLHLG